jgi:hypothetical protein
MRAIDCPRGHHVEAPDDAQLLRVAREHVDRDQPEMDRTGAPIREWVTADRHDLETMA